MKLDSVLIWSGAIAASGFFAYRVWKSKAKKQTPLALTTFDLDKKIKDMSDGKIAIIHLNVVGTDIYLSNAAMTAKNIELGKNAFLLPLLELAKVLDYLSAKADIVRLEVLVNMNSRLPLYDAHIYDLIEEMTGKYPNVKVTSYV